MCDMCSSPEAVYRIELEGSMLNVCEKCSSYGRVVARIKKQESEENKHKPKSFSGIKQEFEAKPEKKTETIQIITSNYSNLIKDKREKLGLKQKELGNKIAERESVIHKLESGHMKPGIPLARKLEKFLKINIVEEVELDSSGIRTDASASGSEGLTLGDFVKKR